MRSRNLAKQDVELRDLEKAGLQGFYSHASNLSELREVIMKNGSAIVSIEVTGVHAVVVDDISQDLSKVRLRDPYHGWEITVTAEAFVKAWEGKYSVKNTSVVQARS